MLATSDLDPEEAQLCEARLREVLEKLKLGQFGVAEVRMYRTLLLNQTHS